MSTTTSSPGGATAEWPEGRTPYDRATLGFRNYWYPVCLAKEVGKRPVSIVMLGEQLALFRRGDKVFALRDECAHRGIPLSLGKNEFPETNTIACRYHGWVYDLADGRCVGALTDGPDAPVIGRVRVHSYPIEERKGILWVWMGIMAPAPVEDDIPGLMVREDTQLKIVKRETYGNWRAHAENIGFGHAPMLHRDSVWMLSRQIPAHMYNFDPHIQEDLDGKWVMDRFEGSVKQADYPGLGMWPNLDRKPWRYRGSRSGDIFGIRSFISLRLPGINRVIHTPLKGSVYYEFYVPVTEDSYRLWQVTAVWPKNPLDWFRIQFGYYLWGRWGLIERFISQDRSMVRYSSDFAKRNGGFRGSPNIYRPDAFHQLWQQYCNENARGEQREAKVAATAPELSGVGAGESGDGYRPTLT